MSTFVNNDVASGNVIYASDHNTQGALIAAVLNGGIDNSNINASAAISTSKLADDSGITTAKISDGSITPEKLQSGTGTSWPWATFALSWTNLTPGNGTTDYAKYSQVGKDVKCRTKFTLGSTSSASGLIKQSLPVTSISYGASPFQSIGHGVFYDVSANIYYPIGVLLDSTSNITFHMMQTASTFGTLFYLDNANPVTPANGDFIQASYFYEAA